MFFVKYLIDILEKEEKDEKNELSMAEKMGVGESFGYFETREPKP